MIYFKMIKHYLRIKGVNKEGESVHEMDGLCHWC